MRNIFLTFIASLFCALPAVEAEQTSLEAFRSGLGEFVKFPSPVQFHGGSLIGYSIHRVRSYPAPSACELRMTGLAPESQLHIPLRQAHDPETAYLVVLKLMIPREFRFSPDTFGELLLVDEKDRPYRYLGIPTGGVAGSWADLGSLKGLGQGGADPVLVCAFSAYPAFIDVLFEVPGDSPLRLKVGTEERQLFAQRNGR